RPSSASISRTRWPLPKPPIAGLQDIAPIVANRWVISAVRAPMRAAAAAASQPACPPPITMTSNFVRTARFYRRERRPTRRMPPNVPGWNVSRETPASGGGVGGLLPNTEVAEDHVEHVLDIDPAGQAAKRPGGEAQFLGDQFLTG